MTTINTTRTLIHPSDKDGCGFYRILQPATALSELKPLHFVLSYRYYMIHELKHHNINKVVLQRHTDPHMLEHLKFYKSLNLNIVHDQDDLLWQVPPTNPYHRYFKGVNKKILREALSMSDTIVASTEELAEQTFKFVRKRPVVLPNMVSKKHYQAPTKRTGEKLRIGWAGSNTHVGDLRIISPLVSDTLDKYDWVFMGYCDPAWKDKVEFHEFVPVDTYMDKIKSLNLDAVVIPLEHNLFNECKSRVKLLEFGAIGVPAVTTDIAPYKYNPNPKIASNNKAWINFRGVLESWEDESVRYQAALDAFAWAKTGCLEDNIDNVQMAWKL